MRSFAEGLIFLAVSVVGCQAPRATKAAPIAPARDIDLLPNGQFDEVSAPWTEYFGPGASGNVALDGGRLCLTVSTAGTNEWDAQMRARGLPLLTGHAISVRLRATATPAATLTVKLAMQAAPYTTYWRARVEATSEAQVLEEHFVMTAPSDPTAELAVMAGGSLAPALPAQICIDDVSVRDPDPPPRPLGSEPKPSPIRLNQLGFRPGATKLGVLLSDAADGREFSVIGHDGQAVFRGRSEPRGRDAASGDSVHWLDFSSFAGPCEGCQLESAGARSAPFRVHEDVLRPLVTGALAYFYYNRSGVPIELPYAREAQWTRPAGHGGDAHVSCHPDRPCDYYLDASGGWYDAGDYGKYLVNGGLALFLLQNLYEHQRGRGLPAFDDGTLAIPEQKNAVPDLLDETRYEADFFLRMQVPSGPLRGMAHHKIHGNDWTSLGTAPEEDRQTRYVYPPSTAASLNLAATAAQASRLHSPYDAAFSKRARAVAEEAYRAALAHPSELAGTQSVGGGPYDDTYLEDEFAWAAR
jgi:endoglucanase